MTEGDTPPIQRLLRESLALGGVSFVVAAAFFVWSLDAAGLWSLAELPVLDRARAANGAPLEELVRSPWFPDWIRAHSYARWESDWGLRLPGAIAASLTVGLGAMLCRLRGASRVVSMWCALFLLAFPAVAVGARTVTGNPFAECGATLCVTGGIVALHTLVGEDRPKGVGGMIAGGLGALLGVLGLAVSVASAGIVVGGIVPVVALALCAAPRNRIVSVVLWVAALIAAVIAYRLIKDQGDGFIPLLGASKDELLITSPHRRSIAGSIRELTFGLFPFAPFVLLGAFAHRNDRWPLLWLLAGLLVVSVWAAVYGLTPVPVAVPAAIAAAAGLDALLDPTNSKTSRRMGYAVIFAGLLILGKDATRSAHAILSPYFTHQAGVEFPAEALEAPEALESLARMALLLLTAAFVVSPRSDDASEHRDGPLSWITARLGWVSPRLREMAGRALATLALAYAAVTLSHELLDRTGVHLSSKAPFERFAQYAGGPAGDATFPEILGTHRLNDPGVERYGPPAASVVPLDSRGELHGWIGGEQAAAAMIRRSALAPLHSAHRKGDWPLYVVDNRHDDLVLVSNVLPNDAEDESPITAIVLDEAPQLEHQTLVRFDNNVEIIGWEVEGPLRRGGEVELRVAFRVLRHMTAGTKLYARFQKGKMSRVNALPHVLAEGVYPPNNWSSGDYILHRFRFEIPSIEVFPGPHDFIVGMRRTETKNYPITVPEGETGEHGVRIRGKKHEFAIVGEVEIR